MKPEVNALWISVETALPLRDQCIIYHAPGIFSSKTSPQAWIGKCDSINAFYSEYGFFGGGEVTHWTPIPQCDQFTQTSVSKPDAEQWIIFQKTQPVDGELHNLRIGQYDPVENVFFSRLEVYPADAVPSWIALPSLPDYVEEIE